MACAQHEPSARVDIAQGVVLAVSVAVEALGIVGALHIGIHGEETTHLRVVHAAVHVDKAESIEVLVAREASVEHRGFDRLSHRIVLPCVGVAEGAPSIV